MTVKIGFLYSLVRKEEKLLLQDLQSRSGVEVELIDVRKSSFNLKKADFSYDVVLERCVNHSMAIHSILLYEAAGIPCVNNAQVATTCGDKLLTAVALEKENVPQPEVRVAFTEKTALKTIEDMGYPVVMKPAVGSWGRLLSKVNDREAAEAILEHKSVLGTYHHSIFFIQNFIEKGGRDIRAFVIEDECIAAIYRSSKHWITNTALGAKTRNCPVTDEIQDVAVRAARAVGGGIVAVDLFETDDGIIANEVNYTMEFRNSIAPTGVEIHKRINDYVIEKAREYKHEKS